MPISITVHVDHNWEELEKRLLASPDWMPKIFKMNLDKLKPFVIQNMRAAVEQNRYTGALESSIEGRTEQGMDDATLTVSPMANRGRWDAGTILELGTGPIPNAPWMPIKQWAEFKGLPPFPVWYKIRREGVSAHPFLERTIDLSQSSLEWTAQSIAGDIATQIAIGDVT